MVSVTGSVLGTSTTAAGVAVLANTGVPAYISIIMGLTIISAVFVSYILGKRDKNKSA
jgi:hypothetical protein